MPCLLVQLLLCFIVSSSDLSRDTHAVVDDVVEHASQALSRWHNASPGAANNATQSATSTALSSSIRKSGEVVETGT